jgi:hypothetical protein
MSATIPLRIDAELVHQARSSGALHDRPPTAQIEHWAKLGRVLEAVLSGASVARVKQAGRVDDLEAILAYTQTPAGRAQAQAVIARHQGPVYAVDPERPHLVVEEAPDGTRRRGRFVNRQFVPLPERKPAKSRQRVGRIRRTR